MQKAFTRVLLSAFLAATAFAADAKPLKLAHSTWVGYGQIGRAHV